MEDIIIRRAKVEDAKRIAEIKIEGWQTAYRGIVDDNFLESMDKEEEIEKRRNNIENGVNIIVAELGGDVAGFCMYRDNNRDVENYPEADCEISALYVNSKLKRQGIGRKLVKYVIENLKAQGKNKMILGCLKENYPSRAFYEKMGGKVICYTELDFGGKPYGIAMYEFELDRM